MYKHIVYNYRGRQPNTHAEIVKKKVLFRAETVKYCVCVCVYVFGLIKYFNVSVYTSMYLLKDR